MTTVSFKEFLTLVVENDQLNKNVADIQAQMSQIDNTINQRTSSLMAQKAQLQRRYSQLLKQKQAADQADQQKAKQQDQQMQKQTNQNQQMQTNNPGVTLNNIPGNNNLAQQRI